MPDPIYLRELDLDDLNNLSLEELAGMQLGHRNPADRVVSALKQIGKFIYADRWAREQTVALQKIAVGAMNQVQAADPAAYDDLTEATLPFISGITTILQSLENAQAIARAACVALLTKAVAVDLGLVPGTDLATVGTELAYAMQDNTLTVANAGDNPDGFAAYFKSALDIDLPASATPNVLDAWIDDDLT